MTRETTTDIVAVGAVTSPGWLHYISGLANDVLPIAGVAWLIVQIILKIRDHRRIKRG